MRPDEVDGRAGAILGACVFAGAAVYTLVEAATGATAFDGRPELAYLGASLFAALAGRCVYVAYHREERQRTPRPSRIATVVQAFEAASYVIALGAGLSWLARRLLGRAGPPDELQRAGLIVLAFIATILVVAGLAAALRRTDGDAE